jgi:pyrimidine-specific ribonucleoside hydrolase
VTINPGTRDQVAVVRRILERLDHHAVPVGARDPARAGEVSPFHHAWLGDTGRADPDAAAHEVLASALTASTVLLSGAPLHNVRDLLRAHPDARVDRWVAQGGFAGDNLVPPERRLPKFDGLITTESHNLGANKKATLAVLADDRVRLRQLVSKNVTHATAWDRPLQDRMQALDGLAPGMQLAREAMAVLLREAPEGKLLHDPLAACAAIDPGIVEWAEVTVIYAHGRWGAEPAPGSSTLISVGMDRPAFLRTLVAPATWDDA